MLANGDDEGNGNGSSGKGELKGKTERGEGRIGVYLAFNFVINLELIKLCNLFFTFLKLCYILQSTLSIMLLATLLILS